MVLGHLPARQDKRSEITASPLRASLDQLAGLPEAVDGVLAWLGGMTNRQRYRVLEPFYRQVPGGVQRVSDHLLGSPDDLASELLAARDEILLVGDGALRYLEAFEGLKRVEIVDQGLAHPSATDDHEPGHDRST